MQAGVIKIKVPLTTLRVRQQQRPKTAPKAVEYARKKARPMELDVRGMTVDEAMMVINMRLDEAVLSNRSQTTIIHGKGTGALAGVRNICAIIRM